MGSRYLEEQRFGQICAVPKPIKFSTDNESCYTTTEIRDLARSMNIRLVTTPIESPQSNGTAESFAKTFNRGYVTFGDLTNAKTVLAQLPAWFEHYNSLHPRSALKYLSPKMFRQLQLTNTECPVLQR